MSAGTGAPAVDPGLVEILNNEIAAISEEIGIVIWKTCRSPTLKSGDFGTAVCDAEGRVVGQGAFSRTAALVVFEALVSGVAEKFRGRLQPGDVLVSNDPFAGMTHLPDVAVVVPAFVSDDLVGFSAAYSHHSDVGGRFAGGVSSRSTSAYEEGLAIPAVKVHDGGRVNKALLETLARNVRMSSEWLADLEAKVAGAQRGARGLAELAERNGAATFAAVSQHLIDHSGRAARAIFAAMRDGSWSVSDSIPDEGEGAIELRLRLSIEGERLVADFAGSSPQGPHAMNTPLGQTKAAVVAAVEAYAAAGISPNSGFFEPIEVRAPERSVVNACFPAAVGGRVAVYIRLIDMAFRALSLADPARAAVPAEGGDGIHFAGIGPDGREFGVLDGYWGGWGARADKDGIDGVAMVHSGSYGCIPAEVLERQVPVVVEGFGYVPDTGGPGRFRGSVAIFRQWRFLAAGRAMVRTLNLGRSEGLHGGRAGAASRTEFEPPREVERRSHVHVEVRPGERIFHATAGAGGCGDPFERDPELVLADVVAGKVSVERASEDYGVVIASAGPVVDVEATAAHRAAREPGRT